MLDFGRALAHLGRAGWDNENTLESQGERYTTFLRDLELVDDEGRLTATGSEAKAELTLPIHMSLRDLAGQLNPGGARGGRERRARPSGPRAPPRPRRSPPRRSRSRRRCPLRPPRRRTTRRGRAASTRRSAAA